VLVAAGVLAAAGANPRETTRREASRRVGTEIAEFAARMGISAPRKLVRDCRPAARSRGIAAHNGKS
jgi:hypothetical protein